MRNTIYTLLTLFFALPLSSAYASNPQCPGCHDLACDVVGSTIEMSGPGAEQSLDEAYLVIDDGMTVCELTVDPDDVDGPETPKWDVVLSYGSECGTNLTGALLYIVPTGGSEEAFGACL